MGTFWRDRPVLVTGATGLVGSWLARHLYENGAEVVCLMRDRMPQSELVRSGTHELITVVQGDVRDELLVRRLLGEHAIDTVFHLAAQPLVGVANADPSSTFETNIAGTWRVLEAVRRSAGVAQVVVASAASAYGAHEVLPCDEETPLEARHPRDVSKACADLLARSYAATYGTPVVLTRFGNVFGGGDLHWSRLIPGTIRAVLRGERPVVRSDGSALRDYLFVDDAVLASTLLCERLAADRTLIGQAFNFVYEKPESVLEVVERILSQMGSGLLPEIRGEPRAEIQEQILSARRARELLGWRPAYSLEEGLARTVEWYRHFFR